jgi:tryptophan synthase beta chain
MSTSNGRFGPYGGRFVSETLIAALDELEGAATVALADHGFRAVFDRLLGESGGRPTPLSEAVQLSAALRGSRSQVRVRVFLKREDLCHTGAHKINNSLGQVLLAKRMGKTRIIAETGAGQHGVATASACALFDIPCEIYMGQVDIERQALNVFRMKLLGATVHPVREGTATLKDALNEAMRDWVTNVSSTHYVIGSVAGPHPYPTLVRDLQAVIGREAREQIQVRIGRLPDALVACVGGGSNALGLFHAFRSDDVRFYGVEAAGEGLDSRRHAATLTRGRAGVLHGARSYVLCDDEGQIEEAHSVAAGLDYPGVGPEHAHLKDTGRAQYLTVTDAEALDAVRRLSRAEGIIPALESAHAIAALPRIVTIIKSERPTMRSGRAVPEEQRDIVIVVNLSGRGDKDMAAVTTALEGALS